MYAGETQGHKCVSRAKGVQDVFGCHSDVSDGRWRIHCWKCLGDGCDFCSGAGIVAMKSCPSRASADALARYGDVFRSYKWLEDKSIFPVVGALCDQTAYFIHCVDYIRAYSNMFREKKREAEDRMKSIRGKKLKKGK